MRAIFEGWEAGAYRPHIDRVFSLEQAAEAHRLLETRASKGKLLLRTR
jgi:NADPH:quinone reductase-like Zn-dependent oxidoreductase